MWDFSIGRAFGMLLKTMPYLIFRVMVYSGIALGYVLLSGIGAGIGYGIGGLGGPDGQATGALVGGLIGFGVGSGIMFFLREYLLYVVKAGHIAVLVELLDGRPLPDGKGQVAYGASVVKQRFVQSSVLFGLDRLLKGVIRVMTRVVEGVANFLPIPGTQAIVGFIRAMLKLSVGFLDELILAHAIRSKSDNPWKSSADALVLYGQNGKSMMKNAFFATLLMYLVTAVLFAVFLIPAGLLVWMLPGQLSAMTMIFALVFAWAAKAALLEPLALVCMMQAYFKVIDGQQPDPVWDQRLTKMTGKFGKIKQQAIDWVPQPGATVEPVATPVPATQQPRNSEG